MPWIYCTSVYVLWPFGGPQIIVTSKHFAPSRTFCPLEMTSIPQWTHAALDPVALQHWGWVVHGTKKKVCQNWTTINPIPPCFYSLMGLAQVGNYICSLWSACNRNKSSQRPLRVLKSGHGPKSALCQMAAGFYAELYRVAIFFNDFLRWMQDARLSKEIIENMFWSWYSKFFHLTGSWWYSTNIYWNVLLCKALC